MGLANGSTKEKHAETFSLQLTWAMANGSTKEKRGEKCNLYSSDKGLANGSTKGKTSGKVHLVFE